MSHAKSKHGPVYRTYEAVRMQVHVFGKAWSACGAHRIFSEGLGAVGPAAVRLELCSVISVHVNHLRLTLPSVSYGVLVFVIVKCYNT